MAGLNYFSAFLFEVDIYYILYFMPPEKGFPFIWFLFGLVAFNKEMKRNECNGVDSIGMKAL